MSDILCITNRTLCRDNFLRRIQRIAEEKPAGILLREKDLSEKAYKELAYDVLEICQKSKTRCILHSFASVAKELHCTALHLPLPILSSLSEEDRKNFEILGASCHSVKDAVFAERLGCTYITAGHIFATDCKKGLPGRGLPFLHKICESVSIPVYAIGGITPECVVDIKKNGASGICVMSGAMKCENVNEYFSALNLKI